jgi:hypothetical protein
MITRQKISPPELAARWGVDAHKVLCWIRSGELKAVNLATTLAGRPRYAIDEREIELFELRRSTTGPAPAPRRRRARDLQIIEFFQ